MAGNKHTDGGPDQPASPNDSQSHVEAHDQQPQSADEYTTSGYGQEAAADLQTLDEQLAEAQEKVATYHDQLLRARAEVENVRRRAEEDVAKARKFSIEGFAE